MIFSPAFSISIARGCDAIEAMALFASALLAFPARWRPKLIGLLGGIVALFLLNIIRIVTLFLTGVYFPKAFEIMHLDVWQALFLLFAVGLWIFTIQRAMRITHDAAK
jgi:exosortase/archaeosortase family protein